MNSLGVSAEELFDLKHTLAGSIFQGKRYVWDALPDIHEYILSIADGLPAEYSRVEEFVWIGKGTSIEPTAAIKGPAIIGCDCEIRHCAYLRGDVILGNGVVVGNSTEIKNSILFDHVQVPHFNYVGDSILGHKSHLGAGAIISNVKSDKGTVVVRLADDVVIDTKLRKFGAMVGDFAEVGCNAVLNPGTMIGRRSIVYPLTMARGFIPSDHILKNNGVLVKKNKQEV